MFITTLSPHHNQEPSISTADGNLAFDVNEDADVTFGRVRRESVSVFDLKRQVDDLTAAPCCADVDAASVSASQVWTAFANGSRRAHGMMLHVSACACACACAYACVLYA